jgi:AraC family transcriptional regulator, activator of mtrCDE
MRPFDDLDRLLAAMDVTVQSFISCRLRDSLGFEAAPPNAVMIHYVLSGSVKLALDNRPCRLCGPGSLILVPPGLTVILEDVADGSEEPSVAAGVVLVRLPSSMGLLDGITAPIVEDMSRQEIVGQALRLILQEKRSDDAQLGKTALIGALMKTCILALLRRFFRRPGISQKIVRALVDPRLAGVVAQILDDPGGAHSVASLAKQAGLSPATFTRQFSAALGSAPMEFVAKTRLHYAADMLRSSRTPIKVIAASIGFASRSHFSRAFRNAYGCDPTRFREVSTEQVGPLSDSKLG